MEKNSIRTIDTHSKQWLLLQPEYACSAFKAADDTSEQVEKFSQLICENDQLKSILNCAGEGILAFDTNFHITYANTSDKTKKRK